MISLRTFCRPSSSCLPCNSFLFRSIATKNSYHQRLKALRSEDFRSYKDKSNGLNSLLLFQLFFLFLILFVSEAKAVFQDMLKSDHKPKAKEFFCLISILLRHKRLEEAMRYFQLLLDSYHHLLSDPKIDAVFASFVGFYKHRETLESYSERASLLFDTMKQYQVPFTSSVFAAWLSARARLSSPEIDYVALVEDVLARASECDCKVDIVLLNAIVKCLVESKNVDQARMYYEQYEGEALKKLGFFRSVQSTWNALLRWARDFDEALRYFDLFEKHKVFKNSESYSSLLQALLRDQTLSCFKKAAYRKKILKDLRDSKIALHTTGVSLLTVLMVEEGMHWRDILSENEEFNMQEEVLASMLEALHRLHKKYEVLECWDELYAREDFAPLMARMPSKGWVALIGSCQGKTNERSMSDYLDEERSNEMAEHMAELDVKIDEAIVCKWIECFCYGDLGSAEYMFHSVLDGLVPGVPTLNEPHLSALLFNLSSHRRGAVLVKDFFFQGFEKLRQKPSSRACRYYIRSASIAKEHFREVVNFFRRLPDMGIPCDEFMCYTILKVAQAQPETEWGVTGLCLPIFIFLFLLLY